MLIVAAMLLCICAVCRAAETMRVTLEDCREMALSNSHSARSQEESKLAAEYSRKAALAAMFPRISANGGYMWNSRDAHLLANETEFSLGTAKVGEDGTRTFKWNDNSALGKLATATEGTALHQPLTELEQEIGQKFADIYGEVYDKLTIDLTHIVVAQVGITQPIYTGGRLTQLYKIAKSTEAMAEIESDAKRSDIIYSVDEAYWRVVAVSRKKELAEQYYNLLCQLEKDVTEAVNEGVATQSDLLKVTTKRGDAEVKKLQATNGLALSQMALAQVCCLPLETEFELDESELSELRLPSDSVDAEAAVAQRTTFARGGEDCQEQCQVGSSRFAAEHSRFGELYLHKPERGKRCQQRLGRTRILLGRCSGEHPYCACGRDSAL